MTHPINAFGSTALGLCNPFGFDTISQPTLIHVLPLAPLYPSFDRLPLPQAVDLQQYFRHDLQFFLRFCSSCNPFGLAVTLQSLSKRFVDSPCGIVWNFTFWSSLLKIFWSTAHSFGSRF
jgi:hypothetical protein